MTSSLLTNCLLAATLTLIVLVLVHRPRARWAGISGTRTRTKTRTKGWHDRAGWIRLLAFSLTVLRTTAAELSDYTTPVFSGAGNCAFCHDQSGRGLTDKRGKDVSIATDWRATMMAHSFKDPFWRATMEAEVAENPKLRSFIENKCQTCHAPVARAQAYADGTNELGFAAAKSSPLAAEGVACTLCHQIQAKNLGTAASFTGHFTIGTERRIFGPYEDVVTMPMRHHVDYTPAFGAHTQDSKLCATCHTLFTPALAADGKVIGEFPEQVPYLEWRNSDYARRGQQCQDCHLPRLDEPIKISSRPPWLDPRQPFWRHQFAGGNAFMLSLLTGNAETLDANADSEQFKSMIAKSRDQLRHAAKLRVSGERQGDALTLRVQVENLTGHKFPTGHPYRRAWLHVRITDRRGRTLFESGATDREGRIVGLDDVYPPHRDVITKPDEVQIYQAVMADADQRPTWSLLRAASYLKDNRLPPKGFKPGGVDAPHIAVLGVDSDANFHKQANGRDQVTYHVPISDVRRPLVAEVELLYQSVPPESAARLMKSSAPAASEFARLYAAMDKQPERVQIVRKRF
jgi:hypothetical protein